MDKLEESFVAYFQSLFDESDRGCVLLVASKLDESLENLHRQFIESASDSALVKTLFEYPQALSTFASKIQIGYAYGLIEKETYSDCNLLRKLRNDVAHSSADFSFGMPEIRDRVLALNAPKRLQKRFLDAMFVNTEGMKEDFLAADSISPKMYFILAGMGLDMEIILKAARIVDKRVSRLRSETGDI